ncbi:hypothetical protein BDW62DRAFT_197266 [Aspergillus aurantiobrunneus]
MPCNTPSNMCETCSSLCAAIQEQNNLPLDALKRGMGSFVLVFQTESHGRQHFVHTLEDEFCFMIQKALQTHLLGDHTRGATLYVKVGKKHGEVKTPDVWSPTSMLIDVPSAIRVDDAKVDAVLRALPVIPGAPWKLEPARGHAAQFRLNWFLDICNHDSMVDSMLIKIDVGGRGCDKVNTDDGTVVGADFLDWKWRASFSVSRTVTELDQNSRGR